jgi:hypothetical protein
MLPAPMVIPKSLPIGKVISWDATFSFMSKTMNDVYCDEELDAMNITHEDLSEENTESSHGAYTATLWRNGFL